MASASKRSLRHRRSIKAQVEVLTIYPEVRQRPETGARNNTTTASIAQAQTPPAQLEQAAEHPLETDHSAAHLSPPPPELVDQQEVLAPNPNTGKSKRQRKQTQQLNISAKGKTYDPVHDRTEQFSATTLTNAAHLLQKTR